MCSLSSAAIEPLALPSMLVISRLEMLRSTYPNIEDGEWDALSPSSATLMEQRRRRAASTWAFHDINLGERDAISPPSEVLDVFVEQRRHRAASTF